MKFHLVTWESLQLLTHQLAEKITESGYKPDLIVAIARGGLSISHILSDFLRLPITTFTISTYRDFQQQAVPEIKLKIGDKLHNKKIILVDDCTETGKTFIRGKEYLKELHAETVKTAALFHKPWSTYEPDYYATTIDKWIIFPFDMRETVEELIKVETNNGSTVEEVKKKLAGLGIPQHYINRYSK